MNFYLHMTDTDLKNYIYTQSFPLLRLSNSSTFPGTSRNLVYINLSSV